jgi:two-component system cell cycle sensor histidine kinase/response regulator CckA
MRASSANPGLTDRAREWVSGGTLRIYGVLLLAVVLPIAGFSVYVNRMLSTEAEQEATVENTQLARLAAVFLEDHFRNNTQLMAALAKDPEMVRALESRNVAQMTEEMRAARELSPNSALMSLYDMEGTMLAIWPPDSQVIGRNYAFRDWYKGAVKSGNVYVSEVYRPQATPELSVAVSVPIRDAKGGLIGILAAPYTLKQVTEWLRGVNSGGSSTISVVDQNGRLMANPSVDVIAPAVDMNFYQPVKDLLAGKNGNGLYWREGKPYFVSYQAIAQRNWGVLSERPADLVWERAREARRQFIYLALFFIAVALLGGAVVASLYRRQKELAERVTDLTGSEARYRSLIQGAVCGIYRSNQSGFLSVNPALVEMLGYSTEREVLALQLEREIYVDSGERECLMKDYELSDDVKNVEVQWRRKDGTPITVALSGRAVKGADGRTAFFEMIAENVTERRNLEEQLRQSQKMEAIGRLAGGVAHDFNNLLTVISGYNELVLQSLGERDPHSMELQEIKKATERAASLTRQLLAFSRQQVLAPKIIDLNTVVAGMENLLQRLLGESVRLQVQLGQELGSIKADPGQMGQVIMNLAVNARDAMPRGGKLLVETGNVTLDDHYAREHLGIPAGDYVMMAVSDTGEGMDINTQSHIFEPFFTTKAAGRGTGLGLSTVYGIVKQSEGYIWVYSELGRGTTFKVYLPRAQEMEQEIVPPKHPPRPSHAGHETVLLVEDEDGVRSLTKQVLERKGYAVLAAGTAGDAMRLCTEHRGEIDLLLTDVVLQNISGRELAEKIQEGSPDVKVLYMSGYTDDAVLHHGVFAAATAFLQKPFTTESLAQKVREVLDSSNVA